MPEHDSRALWEMLLLESFQAGLSWLTILRKREAFRKAFAGFDPSAVARFNESNVEHLLQDTGIVRSRAKIEAAIAGGPCLPRDGRRRRRLFCLRVEHERRCVARSLRSRRHQIPSFRSYLGVSKKKRGFMFVGPVIVHAWMQAVGMLNGHARYCFKRR